MAPGSTSSTTATTTTTTTKKLMITCLLIVAAVLVAAPTAQATMTCNDVISNLTPCVDYIKNNGNMPAVPGPCCAGIKTLGGQATSIPDRQTVCKCLKTVAQGFPKVDSGLVGSLLGKCGVHLSYKIDPSVDCAMVQ